MFFISFKNINSHKFTEIIVNFEEIRDNYKEDNKSENKEIKVINKKKIIDFLYNKDLNELLNEITFNFIEIEIKLECHYYKIEIYNKTLLRKAEESQMRNSAFPTISNERDELLNVNILFRNIKYLDINNVKTEIVFENFQNKYLYTFARKPKNNEKKLESSNFKLDNDEQKVNNNNIMKESNNINNQKNDVLDSSENNIINPKIFKNINNYNDNQSFDEKEIYINPEFGNEQINNLSLNESQPNFFQCQNNNFNYNNNQNIYQNDNNDYISNYNNKNHMHCINNNIIQNNNNQVLFSNNNILVNNNYNNQPINQIFNSNNEKNNINQQNIFQTKLIMMEQDKKNIENIKNKEINELKKKINELEKDIKNEKDKNKLLEQNINSLKEELNEEIKKRKDLEKNIEMKNNNINDLNNIILEKEKKINILEKKLSRFPFELNEEEKLMSVIFTTMNEKFHYSIICKNTDIFNTIENKLYDAFPEYSETENYFLFKGNKINKVKTLEYNKIKNNDLIILKQIDVI